MGVTVLAIHPGPCRGSSPPLGVRVSPVRSSGKRTQLAGPCSRRPAARRRPDREWRRPSRRGRRRTDRPGRHRLGPVAPAPYFPHHVRFDPAPAVVESDRAARPPPGTAASGCGLLGSPRRRCRRRPGAISRWISGGSLAIVDHVVGWRRRALAGLLRTMIVVITVAPWRAGLDHRVGRWPARAEHHRRRQLPFGGLCRPQPVVLPGAQ